MQEDASLVALLRELVGVPTRSGLDDYGPMFRKLQFWLHCHGVATETLSSAGRPVALIGQIDGGRQAPAYVLNATVDTAGFGDLSTWRHEPTSAATVDGWLYGRGAADSKAGVAIFCHVLASRAARDHGASRPLSFVFDADEHVGQFTGMSSFLQRAPDEIAGVFIGYPGFDRILAGARGFSRATVTVHSAAGHTGSSRSIGENAIGKGAELVKRLTRLNERLRAIKADAFPVAPGLTVTGIRGGGEFSMVPDRCEIDIDIRLTPSFPAARSREEIEEAAEALDLDLPTRGATEVTWHDSWPPYALPPAAPLVTALVAASESVLGRALPVGVAGPSNVGNLLAARGIPATCGFGVACRNLHAPDECVELSTLEPAFQIYERALTRLLDDPQGAA
jgi:succinyl-diaminopimelate desuccinylase